MNKAEFINTLRNSLKERRISDAEDIVSEYEQHFRFKMADGYSEKEVASRLGDPKALAQQFETEAISAKPGIKAFVTLGMVFVDFIAIAFFLVLFAWVIALAVAVVALVGIGIVLMFNLSIFNLLPGMPHFVGFLFGITALGLAALVSVESIYSYLLTRQLMRSYHRWRRNTLATTNQEELLPGIPAHPQIPTTINRRIRNLSLIALTVFILSSASGFILASLAAGSLQFWHAWGWFGYP